MSRYPERLEVKHETISSRLRCHNSILSYSFVDAVIVLENTSITITSAKLQSMTFSTLLKSEHRRTLLITRLLRTLCKENETRQRLPHAHYLTCCSPVLKLQQSCRQMYRVHKSICRRWRGIIWKVCPVFIFLGIS